MDTLEVCGRLLAKGELRGEGVGRVKGKWCVTDGLERLGVEARDGSPSPLFEGLSWTCSGQGDRAQLGET